MSSSELYIGYQDGIISNDVDTAFISKVGGHAIFFNSKINATHLKCSKCKRFLYLIAQIYAPLDDIFDRNLYVFGCNSNCQYFRCVREIRQQPNILKSKKSDKETDKKQNLGDIVFGGDGWGNDNDSEDDEKEKEKEQEEQEVRQIENQELNKDKISINEKINELDKVNRLEFKVENEIIKSLSNFDLSNDNSSDLHKIPAFPGYYIYFDTEVEISSSDKIISPKYKHMEIDTSMWKGETYEKQHIKGYADDRAFKKFIKIVNQRPSQLIRYNYNGVPLFYTNSNKDLTAQKLIDKSMGSYVNSAIPRCERCGSERIFEMQIMPAILDLFKVSKYVNQENLDTSMERKKIEMDVSNIEKRENTKGITLNERERGTINVDVKDNMGKNDIQTKKDVFVSTGMEFGTVLIFTCLNNCNESEGQGFIDECVMPQFE